MLVSDKLPAKSPALIVDSNGHVQFKKDKKFPLTKSKLQSLMQAERKNSSHSAPSSTWPKKKKNIRNDKRVIFQLLNIPTKRSVLSRIRESDKLDDSGDILSRLSKDLSLEDDDTFEDHKSIKSRISYSVKENKSEDKWWFQHDVRTSSEQFKENRPEEADHKNKASIFGRLTR
ncbi:uncharacterized protein LOC135129351 [Zophobas morio]|uniref:uncharacterized protein LOC135129351 n=1 Tax=Zophobas morio TaxID=2755281 RepID=UPI003083A50D